MELTDPNHWFGDEQVETGLVTAAVTAPGPAEAQAEENQGLTPEGFDAMLALLKFPPDKLNPPSLAALARSVAQHLYPLNDILLKHGLNQTQYEFLATQHPLYKEMLVQLTKEWQSIGSTAERLKHEALAALEEQLPTLAHRMGSVAEKLTDAVEAAKLFAKIGGVDNHTGGPGAGGERFSISIDLGADTKLTIGPPQDAAPGEESPACLTLRPITQGGSDLSAVRQIGQGKG